MFKGIKYVNANYERINIKKGILRENTIVIGEDTANAIKTIAVPTVVAAESNFVVVDSTGEILQETRDQLESKGYDIKVINMKDPENSDFYNPFHYMGSEDNLATIVEKYFNKGISGGGMYKPWMSLMYEKHPELEDIYQDVFDIIQKSTINDPSHLSLYTLDTLLTPEIKEITSKDTIDLDAFSLGDKKIALYIIYEKNNEKHQVLTNILLNQFYHLNRHFFKKPHHTKLIIADLAEFKHLSLFDRWGIRTFNSEKQNMSFLFLVDSVNNLRKTYSDDSGEILYGCIFEIFFSNTDKKTILYLYNKFGYRLLPDGKDIKDIVDGHCHIMYKNNYIAHNINNNKLLDGKKLIVKKRKWRI